MTMIPKIYTMQAVDEHQYIKLHNTLLCGSFWVLKWRFSSASFKLLQGFLSCFKEFLGFSRTNFLYAQNPESRPAYTVL